MCSVQRRACSTGKGFSAVEGYREYSGGDMMRTVGVSRVQWGGGGIMSSVRDMLSTVRDISSAVRVILSTVRGLRYYTHNTAHDYLTPAPIMISHLCMY